MNRKGFTLAEMLAVIVFIAIVSIITAPIVLDLIEESKQNAAIDDAYGYVDAVNKYYETLSYDNGDVIVVDGQYNIENGIMNGSNASDLDVPVTGSVPVNGKLIYENDKLVSGCLTFNDYRVAYVNGKFEVFGKGSCRINGDFEHDSWDTIVNNFSIDNNAYDSEIGKTRTISFSHSGLNYTITLRLLNTSNPAECMVDGFSQTACGLVVGFDSLVFQSRITEIWSTSGGHFATTNQGGWSTSMLRNLLNYSVNDAGDPDNLYDSLPSDLKAVIIPTAPIVSGSGSSGVSNDVVSGGNSNGDYIYIPSAIEVGIDDSRDDKKYQTRTLDYYKLNPGASYLIKKEDGQPMMWWLRTANHNSDTDFLIILSDGTISTAYSSGFGTSPCVSPTFRIGIN